MDKGKCFGCLDFCEQCDRGDRCFQCKQGYRLQTTKVVGEIKCEQEGWKVWVFDGYSLVVGFAVALILAIIGIICWSKSSKSKLKRSDVFENTEYRSF